MRSILLLVALVLAGSVAAQPAPRPPAVPPDKAAKPLASIALANPGFESTRPGKLGAPEGWWAVQHAGPVSYTYALDTGVRRSGERSMRIENIGPEPFGTIYQAIDAAPYRGKTLRFAGWVRTERATGNRFGAGAGLKLHSVRAGSPHDVAQMREDAVGGTTEWTRYELVLRISNEADQVEVGLNLFGPGIAWLDDTTLDVVEPRREAPAERSSPAR